MTEPPTDRIGLVAALLDKLSGRRLLMAGASFVVGAAGMWLWESRATVMPSVIASPTALWTIGIAVAVIVVWVIFSPTWDRMERKSDALEKFLREEMLDQRAQILFLTAQNREQAALIADQGKQLELLAKREEACQDRLADAEDALTALGHAPKPRSYRSLK